MAAKNSYSDLLGKWQERQRELTVEYLRSTPDPEEPHACLPTQEPCEPCRAVEGLESALEGDPEPEPEVPCCHRSPDDPGACYDAVHRRG